MPKSLPFLRNFGWRVGASILGVCELLAEERELALRSSQYAKLGADAGLQPSEKDACSGGGVVVGMCIQSPKQQTQ